MNFKPLENDEQYKYTKEQVKTFEQHLLKIDDDIRLLLFQRKQEQYFMDIMIAEVQDYEHRKHSITNE